MFSGGRGEVFGCQLAQLLQVASPVRWLYDLPLWRETVYGGDRLKSIRDIAKIQSGRQSMIDGRSHRIRYEVVV